MNVSQLFKCLTTALYQYFLNPSFLRRATPQASHTCSYAFTVPSEVGIFIAPILPVHRLKLELVHGHTHVEWQNLHFVTRTCDVKNYVLPPGNSVVSLTWLERMQFNEI